MPKASRFFYTFSKIVTQEKDGQERVKAMTRGDKKTFNLQSTTYNPLNQLNPHFIPYTISGYFRAIEIPNQAHYYCVTLL